MDTLAQRLHTLRKQAGLTLKQVSTLAGISLTFLADIEHGRTLPSLVTLEAIAEVFGLTTGQLMANVRIRSRE